MRGAWAMAIEFAAGCAARLTGWRANEWFTSAHMGQCEARDGYVLHLMCCPGGKKCPVRLARSAS